MATRTPKVRDFAPGMRVVIRDAEWLIRRAERAIGAPEGKPYELTCIGVSNLVRGKEARFIEAFEDDIEILRPEKTKLVEDTSSRFVQSRLFIDALLRRTPASDSRIHVAQKAAMDVLDYQLEPALRALSSIRPRILIADAVGIGKTLEAGILVSELIARGRGRRILVLAVKAMLEQFQKEFWNRFSIPLTRLDSEGISRLLERIPAGHNPFLHVDRAIISIDTLKQGALYRDFLEKAWWDIIVIDEAHNVADRGTQSQRSRLARQLAGRSDALIMLTATPHDGRPESFASLIDMLDPTVLPDRKNYTAADFEGKGLVVRRFKADIASEAGSAFQTREISTIQAKGSAKEEAVFKRLNEITFADIDKNHQPGQELFKTTLTKALFSSPVACEQTVQNRLKKLRARYDKKPSEAISQDIVTLESFQTLLEAVGPRDFSKYQSLVKMLKNEDETNFGWNRGDPADRLVVFTESLRTLDFLKENLPRDLGMGAKEVVVLKGSDRDRDLMDAVEAFNRLESPVRLMLATDVASEGLNLHRFCHRLIHFDIPWSLMTFQQRNGRIDRYGQTKQPLIRYLQTVPSDESLKSFGDAHIIELLVEKDENAQKNLGDPREFAGTKEEQEARTIARVQDEVEDDFDPFDPFAFLDEPDEEKPKEPKKAGKDDGLPRVIERNLIFSDFGFMKEALAFRRSLGEAFGSLATDFRVDEAGRVISFAPPSDLEARLAYLPREVLPEKRLFRLTDDKAKVQEAIRDAALRPGAGWPELQLLWELHPVMTWMEDWAVGSFGRHSAPLLFLPDRLDVNEAWFLMQAGYPNRRGFVPVHDWAAVRVREDGVPEVLSRKALMDRVDFARPLVNTGEPVPAQALARLLPRCVKAVRRHIEMRKFEYLKQTGERLNKKIKELENLQKKQMAILAEAEKRAISDREREKLKNQQKFVEQAFESAQSYAKGVFELEDKPPFIQVAAVFCGSIAEGAFASTKE